jgi:hypothetical protein
MSQFNSNKDYYEILGANERASRRDLDRLYKQLASRRHPDKGGTEEEMKSLNEAYRVLKNEETRREYDVERSKPARVAFVPASSPAAQDIGLLGHGLPARWIVLVVPRSLSMDLVLVATRGPRVIRNPLWSNDGA